MDERVTYTARSVRDVVDAPGTLPNLVSTAYGTATEAAMAVIATAATGDVVTGTIAYHGVRNSPGVGPMLSELTRTTMRKTHELAANTPGILANARQRANLFVQAAGNRVAPRFLFGDSPKPIGLGDLLVGKPGTTIAGAVGGLGVYEVGLHIIFGAAFADAPAYVEVAMQAGTHFAPQVFIGAAASTVTGAVVNNMTERQIQRVAKARQKQQEQLETPPHPYDAEVDQILDEARQTGLIDSR